MSTEWNMVPATPTPEMLMAGSDGNPTDWNDGTDPVFAEEVAGKVWRAMLSAAPDAPAQPVAPTTMRLTIERKIGSYGCAFDGPNVARAYTYKHQPSNQPAWLLGQALAKVKSLGGDYIDAGLYLLQALEQEGFGIFELVDGETAQPDTAPRPAQPVVKVKASDLPDAIKHAFFAGRSSVLDNPETVSNPAAAWEAYERLSAIDPTPSLSTRGEADELDRDIGILIASLEFLAEATGEGLDPEDATLVYQIKADHERRRISRSLKEGK